MTNCCVHYVGFSPERYVRARRIFGGPALIHPGWDMRSVRDVGAGDVVLFANGPADQAPRVKSYSDIEDLQNWEIGKR